MRLVTSARLRALGLLLIEAAGLVLLVHKRLRGDAEVRSVAEGLLAKARAL